MHVVFVAPFFMDTTLRFVRAVATTPGVRCSLLTQEPPFKVPDDLRAQLCGFCQIDDALDARHIERGARLLESKHGKIDKLFGALEHIQVQLADVRAAMGLGGLTPAAARNFRDKARMKDVLQKAELPCARHREVKSSSDAWHFAGKVGYPLVIKPREGAGSKGTFRVDNDKQLAEALLNVRPAENRPAVIEEFITGDEYSFEVLSFHGKPLWHSLTRYLPNPLDAVRNPWIQWCVLLPREVDDARYDDVRKAGFAALQALGMDTGMSHMEWFRRPDGRLAISEIAARPPGAQIVSLNSLACDFDLFKAWALLMTHGQFTVPQRKYAAGAAFFRGQGQGRIKAIHGLEQAQRELGHLVVETKLPQIGARPNSSYEGDGYALLRHPETKVVEQGLRRIVELVYVELG